MEVVNWIALVAAVGGGAFVKELVVGLWKWLTGRQTKERDLVRYLSNELDDETEYRRRVAEHAYVLRTILVQLGQQDLLPPFPERVVYPRGAAPPTQAIHPLDPLDPTPEE